MSFLDTGNETGVDPLLSMGVCSYHIESEEDFQANKDFIEQEACFKHKESWEHIVYIPCDEYQLEEVRNSLSHDCLKAFEEAVEKQFSYICFWAG